MNEEQIIKDFRDKFLKKGPIKGKKYLNGYLDTTSQSIEQFWLSVLAVEIKKAEERGRNEVVDYIEKNSEKEMVGGCAPDGSGFNEWTGYYVISEKQLEEARKSNPL